MTLGVESPNPYSLLKYKREEVSWVPAISQMEETYVSIPLPAGNNDRVYFGRAPESLQMVIAAMKLKDTCSLEEKLWLT